MCILHIGRIEQFSAIVHATHYTTVESYTSYVSVLICVVLDTYQGKGKNKNDKMIKYVIH